MVHTSWSILFWRNFPANAQVSILNVLVELLLQIKVIYKIYKNVFLRFTMHTHTQAGGHDSLYVNETHTSILHILPLHSHTCTESTHVFSKSVVSGLSLRPSPEQLSRQTRCSSFSKLSSRQLMDPTVSLHDANRLPFCLMLVYQPKHGTTGRSLQLDTDQVLHSEKVVNDERAKSAAVELFRPSGPSPRSCSQGCPYQEKAV